MHGSKAEPGPTGDPGEWVRPVRTRLWDILSHSFDHLKNPLVDESTIREMSVFINMVRSRVKKRFKKMILTAFEGKFDEKKDVIPAGICRPHMLQFFQYWGGWGLT